MLDADRSRIGYPDLTVVMPACACACTQTVACSSRLSPNFFHADWANHTFALTACSTENRAIVYNILQCRAKDSTDLSIVFEFVFIIVLDVLDLVDCQVLLKRFLVV